MAPGGIGPARSLGSPARSLDKRPCAQLGLGALRAAWKALRAAWGPARSLGSGPCAQPGQPCAQPRRGALRAACPCAQPGQGRRPARSPSRGPHRPPTDRQPTPGGNQHPGRPPQSAEIRPGRPQTGQNPPREASPGVLGHQAARTSCTSFFKVRDLGDASGRPRPHFEKIDVHEVRLVGGPSRDRPRPKSAPGRPPFREGAGRESLQDY